MSAVTRTVISQQGDTVDAILYRLYGAGGSNLVRATLTINPGLSSVGPVLPAGTSVIVPVQSDVVEIARTSLW